MVELQGDEALFDECNRVDGELCFHAKQVIDPLRGLAQNRMEVRHEDILDAYREVARQIRWFERDLEGFVLRLARRFESYTGVAYHRAVSADAVRVEAPKVLAVTGHRPKGMAAYKPAWGWVRQSIRMFLEKARLQKQSAEGVVAMSGMALGVDQVFAQEALRLGIPLWAAVPFEGQDARWTAEECQRYDELLCAAWRVTIVGNPPKDRHDARDALLGRNTWMVQRADVILAVWDGSSSGGTAHCVREAHKHAKPLLRINPATQTFQ